MDSLIYYKSRITQPIQGFNRGVPQDFIGLEDGRKHPMDIDLIAKRGLFYDTFEFKVKGTPFNRGEDITHATISIYQQRIVGGGRYLKVYHDSPADEAIPLGRARIYQTYDGESKNDSFNGMSVSDYLRNASELFKIDYCYQNQNKGFLLGLCDADEKTKKAVRGFVRMLNYVGLESRAMYYESSDNSLIRVADCISREIELGWWTAKSQRGLTVFQIQQHYKNFYERNTQMRTI